MTDIEQLGTTACNTWLVEIAKGSRTIDIVSRTRSIGLLGALGGASERDSVAGLIQSSDQEIRAAAAVSLSKIESRLAWGGRPRGTPPRSSENMERLAANLAMVASELSRIQDSSHEVLLRDTISALAVVPGARAEYILKGLMRHPSDLVRQTIIESTTPLPREVAADIVRIGLSDKSTKVAAAAQHVMETRWADDVWIQDTSAHEGEDDQVGSSKP
jgi:HEAT repeat protein